MSDFLKFVDELRNHFALHVEISYCKICDWMIYVYRKGMADSYPVTARHSNGDVILVQVQDSDMELCFAKAHVALKEWLTRYEGGY